MQNKTAFTLIELLVVVAIIIALLAMLMPSMGMAIYQAQNLQCVSRQRQFTLATLSYCADNFGIYPDRGVDSGGAEPMWARWAMRQQIGAGDLRLDDALRQYMPTGLAVWCCPLYQGEHGSGAYYGCLEHGVEHNVNPGYMSYSFHGGLKERNVGGNIYNPGDRRRLGQPYVIELASGGRYQRNILYSDTAVGDNGWVPVLCTGATAGLFNPAPGPRILTNHTPPPGSIWQFTWIEPARILAIKGTTVTNWAYDDGSAGTRTANAETALTSGDWTAVPSQGRYMLFPN